MDSWIADRQHLVSSQRPIVLHIMYSSESQIMAECTFPIDSNINDMFPELPASL